MKTKDACHIHGAGECNCPAYLITMGQIDAELERIEKAKVVPVLPQKKVQVFP